MTRRRCLLSVVGALLTSTSIPVRGGQVPPEPARYGAQACGVSVASAQQLEYTSRAMAGGTATAHFFTVEVQGTTFRLFCIRDGSIDGPSDELFAVYRDGFVNHDTSQLVSERPVRLGTATGREIHAADRHGTHSLVRVYVVAGKVFGALISGSQQATAAEGSIRFLDSLRIEPDFDRGAAARR